MGSSVFSDAITIAQILLTAGLVFFTFKLSQATSQMAHANKLMVEETKEAAKVYEQQIKAVNYLRQSIIDYSNSSLGLVNEARASARGLLIAELQRNLDILQTPGGDLIYNLFSSAWHNRTTDLVLIPEIMRKVRWLYEDAFPRINGKVALEASRVMSQGPNASELGVVQGIIIEVIREIQEKYNLPSDNSGALPPWLEFHRGAS